MSNKPAGNKLLVRALRTKQGKDVDVYSFFLHGSDVTKIADISRIARDDDDQLKGFQRKEIKNHVKAIVAFLNSGPVLFPNAIILAMSPDVRFTQSRGPVPDGLMEVAQAGTLQIPVRPEGKRVAWIVDGQQRSLALSQANNPELSVPVVGFVSSDMDTQREQFILVNKAKPLPGRLISELLPEVATFLPKDLAARKLPSELCGLLNRDPRSPFFKLVRRESEPENKKAIVIDTALIEAIKGNLRPPMGALSQYRQGSEVDPDAMYRVLLLYWTHVKEQFSDAWGRPPKESRLMHSAGIRVMGTLMDQIMLRADSSSSPEREIRESLARLAQHCCWTDGVWPDLGWRWNEVQSTSQHISKLSEYLMRLDRELARPTR
jgi:DGQHR domain-containing protein